MGKINKFNKDFITFITPDFIATGARIIQLFVVINHLDSFSEVKIS